MAQKMTPRDVAIQQILRAQDASAQTINRREELGISDETYESAVTPDLIEEINTRNLALQPRTAGEIIQDSAAGLMGTFGAIGNTIGTINAVAYDVGDHIGGALPGGREANWNATTAMLENFASTQEYWNSLKSKKTQAVQRVGQYRQEQAAATRQAIAEAQGREVLPIEQLRGEFSTAVGHYLDNPGQIATEAIAQLPYLLGGPLARGFTATTTTSAGITSTVPTRVAAPLVDRMVARGMSPEAALKAVQAGVVGGVMAPVEGIDAGAGAYATALEAGASEADALKAAFTATAIATPVSAVTGAVASRWDLQPFKARGATMMQKTGNNLADALMEGVQEIIESGTGQLATNVGVRTHADPTQALLEGVGEAAGTGLVVGMGSVGVTRPLSVPTAGLAAAKLAVTPVARAINRAGDALADRQDRKDNEVISAVQKAEAATIRKAAGIPEPAEADTPSAVVTLDDGSVPPYITVPDASGGTRLLGNYEVPAQVDRTDAISTVVTGVAYLQDAIKNANENTDLDVVFNVASDVLHALHDTKTDFEVLDRKSKDKSLTEAERDEASRAAKALGSLTRFEELTQALELLPAEQIKDFLTEARKDGEKLDRMVSTLAALSPFVAMDSNAVPDAVLDEVALRSEGLPEGQRKAVQQVKQAREALRQAPTTGQVRKDILKTGFTGDAENRPSVDHMVAAVIAANAANRPQEAQIEFNRLLRFGAHMADKARRFAEGLQKFADDPNTTEVEIEGVGTWQEAKDGKPAYFDPDKYFILRSDKPRSRQVALDVQEESQIIEKIISDLMASNPNLQRKEVQSPIDKKLKRAEKRKAQRQAKAQRKAAETEEAAAAATRILQAAPATSGEGKPRVSAKDIRNMSQDNINKMMAELRQISAAEATPDDRATAAVIRDEIARRRQLAENQRRIAEREKEREQKKQSKQASKSGTTVKKITETISSLFDRPIARHVSVHATEAEAIEKSGVDPSSLDQFRDRDGVLQSFIHDEKIFFIAENIPSKNVRGVVIRGLGERLGNLRGILGKNFEPLYNNILTWASEGRGFAKVVGVKAIQKGGNNPEHVVAYAIEEAVNGGVKPDAQSAAGKWLNKVIAMFRASLAKLTGKRSDDFTPRDLVNLAYGAAGTYKRHIDLNRTAPAPRSTPTATKPEIRPVKTTKTTNPANAINAKGNQIFSRKDDPKKFQELVEYAELTPEMLEAIPDGEGEGLRTDYGAFFWRTVDGERVLHVGLDAQARANAKNRREGIFPTDESSTEPNNASESTTEESAENEPVAAPLNIRPENAPVEGTPVSRITPEQAARLSDAGLNARIEAIQEKRSKKTNTPEDDATFKVLDEEMSRREDAAAREIEAEESEAQVTEETGSEELGGALDIRPVGTATETGSEELGGALNIQPAGTQSAPVTDAAAGSVNIQPVSVARSETATETPAETATETATEEADGSIPDIFPADVNYLKGRLIDGDEESREKATDKRTRESHTNHLMHSFTRSKRRGLISQGWKALTELGAFMQATNAADMGKEGQNTASWVMRSVEYYHDLLNRMLNNTHKRNPKTLDRLLNLEDLPTERDKLSLQATINNYSEYDPVIARVMAFTGMQFLIGLTSPIKWSDDHINAFKSSFGDKIVPMLNAGWVPASELVTRISQNLRNNLELVEDPNVSKQYTEGTMRVLARDILAMLSLPSENGTVGHPLQITRLQDFNLSAASDTGKVEVTFIRLNDSNENPIRESLRLADTLLDGFFADKNPNISYTIGKPVEKPKKTFRNTDTEIGDEQLAALDKMNRVRHKWSRIMGKVHDTLSDSQMARVLQFDAEMEKAVANKAPHEMTLYELEVHGRNVTILSDIEAVNRLKRDLIKQANIDGNTIYDQDTFYEYDMVTNGRAMPSGTSPQSSKYFRELSTTSEYTYEVGNPEHEAAVRMAIAQGFGAKMDKKSIPENMEKLAKSLEHPDTQKAIDAAVAVLDADGPVSDEVVDRLSLAVFDGKRVDPSPHYLAALFHLAQERIAQRDGLESFEASLSFEIDGMTDGPINLMMLMGMRDSFEEMEKWLALSGIIFTDEPNDPQVIQDHVENIKALFGNGIADLYGVISREGSKSLSEQREYLRKHFSKTKQSRENIETFINSVDWLLTHTGILMDDGTGDYSRDASKKPTQASGYLQGWNSIVNDITSKMFSKLAEMHHNGIDGEKGLSEEANKHLGILLTTYINTKTKQITVYPDRAARFRWDGMPLNENDFRNVSFKLGNYGANGIADATMNVLDRQRTVLSAMSDMTKFQVWYANEKFREAYLAKQKEEEEKGNLWPNQALSRKDEDKILREITNNYALGPVLRYTNGLSLARVARYDKNRTNTTSVVSYLDYDNEPLHVAISAFEDPGLRFGANSIMTAGDGAMVTGLFANNNFNVLNMFDGIYMSPLEINAVQEALNREVKENWQFDMITAVLDSTLNETPDFWEWAGRTMGNRDETVAELIRAYRPLLEAQRERQERGFAEINSRPHAVSHMAGGTQPFMHVPGETTYASSKPKDRPKKRRARVMDAARALQDRGTYEFVSNIVYNNTGGVQFEVGSSLQFLNSAEIKEAINNINFKDTDPVLGAIWKQLSKLLPENTRMVVSSDREALAEYYKSQTGKEYGENTKGVSINGTIYVTDLTAETLVHEVLHSTLRGLTAAFAAGHALPKDQLEALRNIDRLMMDFLKMEYENPITQHAQRIIKDYSDRGMKNEAMQEFLAYGLTDAEVRNSLAKTNVRRSLGQAILAQVIKLFRLGEGTQKHSMLAHLLSDFQRITLETSTIPQDIRPDVALESLNHDVAAQYKHVLNHFYNSMNKVDTVRATRGITEARDFGVQRMNQLGNTGLWKLSAEQQAGAEYVQAMFELGIQQSPDVSALLQRVVDAVRAAGDSVWRTNDDPTDYRDIEQARARREFLLANTDTKVKGTKGSKREMDVSTAADILALSVADPVFNERLGRLTLPNTKVDKGSVDNILKSSVRKLFEFSDGKFDVRPGIPLNAALEKVGARMRKTAMDSVNRSIASPSLYKQFTSKVASYVHLVGEKAGSEADRLREQEGKHSIVSSLLTVVAAATNETYADSAGKVANSLMNQLKKANFLTEIVQQDLVGTINDNEKLVLLKGKATRTISAVRSSLVEQFPIAINKWFSSPLTPEQDAALHRIVGQAATYTLSQNNKDRLADIIRNPDAAIRDAEQVLLAYGDTKKRKIMIEHAARLGRYMAGVSGQLTYRNTRLIAGLQFHKGGDRLSSQEMAALEDLSTLHSLKYLSQEQRENALYLLENEREGWNKFEALIGGMNRADRIRGGKKAEINEIKGYIPKESDPRKQVRLVNRRNVPAEERKGWVALEPYSYAGHVEPDLIYMATTVGKMPPLSGGAIHAVDHIYNGIHYKSGMAVDPGVSTHIKDPQEVRRILDKMHRGVDTPYLPIYNYAGTVVGFQRIMDPKIVDQHTRTIESGAQAAGIWVGRMHEEMTAGKINEEVAKLLKETYDTDVDRRDEYVDITRSTDPTWRAVWEHLPYHTKTMLEDTFNPNAPPRTHKPVWVRKDQVLDAFGHHKATVGDIFTGAHDRWDPATRRRLEAYASTFLGKNAYKYLTIAEDALFSAVGVAKDTIVVKSLKVAWVNGVSNQFQLWAITGNPFWNLRVQAQKHKESIMYLDLQRRISQLHAERFAQPHRQKELAAQIMQLEAAQKKLSIHTLIEAGEFPTIAEGISEIDQFSLASDATAWFEKKVGELPKGVQTFVDYATVAKNTALYQGLDSLIQLGDFVAKATMYQWLTEEAPKGKRLSPEAALAKVNDEFVNYARLSGRTRTYLENAGMMWFYNYKLRILKIILRRMREDPVSFILSSAIGDVLGADTLMDSMPHNVGWGYSLGPNQMIDSPSMLFWNTITPDF